MSLTESAIPSINLATISKNVERRANIVVEDFSITPVYGWHENAKDAGAILQHIPANTIVFTEGHFRTVEHAEARLPQLLGIAASRFALGYYDLETRNKALSASNEFNTRSLTPEIPADPFGSALFRKLFDRGSVVLPADYINLGDYPPRIANIPALRENLSSIGPLSEETIDDIVNANLLIQLELRESSKIREERAVLHILHFLSFYTKAGLINDSFATKDDRVSVSIVFGLAHRNSLSEKLSALGVPVKPIHVNRDGVEVADLTCMANRYAQSDEELELEIRSYFESLT